MRILIVTDAWAPQVNGVVRTLATLRDELTRMGEAVEMLTPAAFRTIPCPTYPEIRLALAGPGAIGRVVSVFRPEAIHIATEGPLGWLARRVCLKRGLPFTTGFHTRFPEYIHARFRIPIGASYGVLRRFHRPSAGVMAPTRTVCKDLESRGFARVRLWGRGVDTGVFRPGPPAALGLPRPIMMFVGRVAVEKNIEAFLRLPNPGTKVVIGDGPQRAALQRAYPDAVFLGARFGAELAACYNAADVFVFPSRTDTFGLVMLEALACGVPVAAYPVMGPVDVLTSPAIGCMDEDLSKAVEGALRLSREDCARFAAQLRWPDVAATFRRYLSPIAA